MFFNDILQDRYFIPLRFSEVKVFDTDKRWKTLGEVFVNKCFKLKPGEKLIIAQEEPETWPLALATYEAAIKAGGFPQIQLKSAYLAPRLYEIRN